MATPVAAKLLVATLIAVPALASAQEAQPEDGLLIEERNHYYTLDAHRVIHLHKQLDARGPRNRLGHPVAGLTRHEITVRYQLRQDAGRCSLSDLRVHARIDIHLPRWEPAQPPAPQLQRQWISLEAELRKHELGHRDNGVQAAQALHQTLLALAPARDCATLATSAKRARITAMNDLRTREDAFDLATDYGRDRMKSIISENEKKQQDDNAERERERAQRILGGH